MMLWKKTKVVVTGAGGFIGSHLVERLLELEANVTAFVRYNSRNDAGLLGLLSDKKKDVPIVFGEIVDLETVRNVVKNAEVIFHLAALVGIPYSYVHPSETFEVNAIGTLNVLTAAKECRPGKVIITSTSEVYGTALYIPIDESHPKQPQSPYAASKIAADAIALSFYHAFNLPVAIVRPFNTYGPGQSDRAIIPTIIGQALMKSEILMGNTESTRDFTFVSDTVEGFLRIAESEHSIGQEINLGSGREIAIGDLAGKIVSIIGRDVRMRQDDERIRPPQSEVGRLLSDNSKAKQLAAWEPQVDLDRGLRLTVEWIRDHLRLYDPSSYRL